MAIRTNLKSLVPRRDAYKREITLLSRGYTSPTAWPGGKLTVYPWDNEVDDWFVENARKLTKEELIFSLFERCCNLNGGRLDDFVADEINLILLVSRARLANDHIRYTSVCPHCGAKKDETIAIPDELEPVGVKEPDYPGFDVFTLPDVQDVVKVRPLLVKDERAIVGRPTVERARVPDTLLRTLMRVVTINDTRPDALEELIQWFRALSPADSKFLEKEGRRITPHLNTAVPHKCDECLKTFDHVLDLGQEFFR